MDSPSRQTPQFQPQMQPQVQAQAYQMKEFEFIFPFRTNIFFLNNLLIIIIIKSDTDIQLLKSKIEHLTKENQILKVITFVYFFKKQMNNIIFYLIIG